MNMKDPFPLLVGEVVVDLVAAEGAGAELLAMDPLLMTGVKNGRRMETITTMVEAEGEAG